MNIKNPISGKWYPINSYIGRKLLLCYLKQHHGFNKSNKSQGIYKFLKGGDITRVHANEHTPEL